MNIQIEESFPRRTKVSLTDAEGDLHVWIKEGNGYFNYAASWDPNNKLTVDTRQEAIGTAITMLQSKLSDIEEVKPLTAEEAFQSAYGKFEDRFNEQEYNVYDTCRIAVQLYVSSQIEHLKRELSK